MQQTISRSDRIFDEVAFLFAIASVVFGLVLMGVGVASPWLVSPEDGWPVVVLVYALGAVGYTLVRIVSSFLSREIRERLARRRDQRIERDLEELQHAGTMTARPLADTFVRVTAPTWTPFGYLHPHDIGLVLDVDMDDDDLVAVKWRGGEVIHSFRHLVAEVY